MNPALSALTGDSDHENSCAAVLETDRASRPSILLIDDDAGVRESLGRMLAAERFRVTMASGGKQALEAISEALPDLVITDLCMAPLTGWDLLLHLQEHRPKVPLFVITGLSRRSSGGADRFATEYFQKPLDPDELLRAIKRHIHTAGFSGGSSSCAFRA